MTEVANRRILLIDDTPQIHEDFRKILSEPARSELDDAEAALFGTTVVSANAGYEMDFAFQGREGLLKVEASRLAGRPYAMAFVDMRMPPGWDGTETIARLWDCDPRVQIVICTAYADQSWDDVLQRLDARDRLLILKKPFDNIEVRQLASALTAKWDMTQQAAQQMSGLEAVVEERTRQISSMNAALELEIIERRQLEKQLIQAEKLASIGQLAAGVAHEINNPMGYILANFGTLDIYLDDLFAILTVYEQAEHAMLSPSLASHLKVLRERVDLSFLREDIPALIRESREGALRVKQIVQDLKNFSQADEHQEWQSIQLHPGIDAALDLIADEIKDRADVLTEYGTLPDVECLPSQLNQMMTHLLLNATQAIRRRERGQITVRTGAEVREVWIEVADTGCGISPEALPRIFEPFYTTKPVGRAAGLGLSLCYGIVQTHGGRIEVNSEVNRGTTFRVTLPIKHLVSVSS